VKLKWSTASIAELWDINDYLEARNPGAAARMFDRLVDAGNSLRDFPERYRKGIEDGTREFCIPGTPYIMVYTVDKDAVRILSIFHGAQDRPRGPAG